MKAVIDIRHLTKSYGEKQAVHDLSMDVAKGEFFGFLGPNGAGKTTTIRMITGIIQPDHGTIAVSGDMGVMPESHGFYSWMSAREYLMFFAELYRIPAPEQSARVQELLKQVSLFDNQRNAIGTFSRGMKQRLGLARALINKPDILILDEPTLGLDPQGQEDIHHLLRSLNKQGVTVFLSSHLLTEVADLCTQLAVINRGKLIAKGTIDDLRAVTKNKSGSLTDIFLELTKS